MKSQLAEAAEQQLIDAAKAMTHEQRLRAFIELSKRMVELQRAGKVQQGSQIKDAHLKALDEHR